MLKKESSAFQMPLFLYVMHVQRSYWMLVCFDVLLQSSVFTLHCLAVWHENAGAELSCSVVQHLFLY